MTETDHQLEVCEECCMGSVSIIMARKAWVSIVVNLNLVELFYKSGSVHLTTPFLIEVAGDRE